MLQAAFCMNHMLRPTVARVDLGAIAHNTALLKKHAGKALMAVVKANAYGHGVVAVARAALEAGADRLAVATAQEALELRSIFPATPIQVLGLNTPQAMQALLAAGIIFSISTPEEASTLSQLAAERNCTACVHVKVDTGMGRLGLAPREAFACAMLVHRLPHLTLEGLFTHFADADIVDSSYTLHQFEQFLDVRSALADANIRPSVCHCANSAATLAYPQTHLDMVRPGISIYGVNPCAMGQPSGPADKLVPAMGLYTHIGLVKNMHRGDSLSYGRTYVCHTDCRIAVLPIGYADGLLRSLSGKAAALVRGQRVPLVGRICMDMCLADISSVPEAAEGDEVCLFGTQAEARILVDEQASLCHTIPYELLCAVSSRVPRVSFSSGAGRLTD